MREVLLVLVVVGVIAAVTWARRPSSSSAGSSLSTRSVHDKNAVAMCAAGSKVRFAQLQRGRAPAVARRMDAGEDLAAVSLRGPGCGKGDDTAVVIIGARADLEAMLNA